MISDTVGHKRRGEEMRGVVEDLVDRLTKSCTPFSPFDCSLLSASGLGQGSPLGRSLSGHKAKQCIKAKPVDGIEETDSMSM